MCSQTCLGMPNISRNNKAPISPERAELFFVFVACSYTCIEAIVLSCSFSWVWSDMPKVLQSNQLLISLERLSDFVDFLHVAIYMLLDIHWIYKNMLFLVGIVRHWLSTNQVARCFKFTKLENYIRYQIDFCI